MKLTEYSLNDLNSYLQDTWALFENNPARIQRVDLLNEAGERTDSLARVEKFRFMLSGTDTPNQYTVPYTDDFSLVPVRLGYYQTGKTVVFLYNKQSRSYKKLPSERTTRTFSPQRKELASINYEANMYIHDLLSASTTYFTIEEAFSQLSSNKYAVPLHTNYALVKKGTHQHPVVYYMYTPIATYDGTTLTPLGDSCHVDKFHLEVQA